MLDCKPVSSLSCPNTRLSLHDGDPLPDPHAYRSMVGALHYLTFTRPDISFVVHQVCQYMSTSTTTHLVVMLIGLETQMIVIPHLVFLSTWATMPSPGQQRNKLQSLDPLLSQSIEHWPLPLLALAIASNPVFHACTKHIEVDFHFIRERVLRKDLVVKFVSTVDQLADIFTKSLSTHLFLELQRNLTVIVPKIEGG
uniref:Reverse transcriptase Ty1/copia-type domain-containing protein n=1 Tax=Fagus sylvatica TaxID=28930 RepID=A0A2N9GXX9_FAGSY